MKVYELIYPENNSQLNPIFETNNSIQCKYCGKLINKSKLVDIFRNSHDSRIIVTGICPFCGHRFFKEEFKTVKYIAKDGIEVFQNESNNDIEKIIFYQSYHHYTSHDYSLAELDVVKVDPNSHKTFSFKKINNYIVKKSKSFSFVNFYLDSFDITALLKNYEFLINDQEIKYFCNRYNRCVTSSFTDLSSFRYCNIRVDHTRLIGSFNRNQSRNLLRYTKNNGNNISSKTFVLLMLYGNKKRYINISYDDFMNFFRFATYEHNSRRAYEIVYLVSKLIKNPDDILDISVLLYLSTNVITLKRNVKDLELSLKSLMSNGISNLKKLLIKDIKKFKRPIFEARGTTWIKTFLNKHQIPFYPNLYYC